MASNRLQQTLTCHKFEFPLEDVTFSSKKAFNYESGQFICHAYANISENEKETLDELIQVLLDPSGGDNSVRGWKPIGDIGPNRDDERRLHVTLLRGHRAVYYHQIKSMVEAIRLECERLQPFSICLDELKIFHNHERTKQFLCIATRHQHEVPNEPSALSSLKRSLRETVDQFATKLTSEDETPDTVAHCSLMYREVCGESEPCDRTLDKLNQLSSTSLEEFPICIVRVDKIQIKIGNHEYNLRLTG